MHSFKTTMHDFREPEFVEGIQNTFLNQFIVNAIVLLF